VAERQGDVDLWLMRADGSGPVRLTQAPGADWLPRWFVPR
jgi:Tol biopolymer transport system component